MNVIPYETSEIFFKLEILKDSYVFASLQFSENVPSKLYPNIKVDSLIYMFLFRHRSLLADTGFSLTATDRKQ